MQLTMPSGFFVTGTDTGIGKTAVTKHLITSFQKAGYKAIGCKPVACGVDEKGDNEDVLVYEAINSLQLPRPTINPFCFELPASPHLAAKAVGTKITVAGLQTKLAQLKHTPVDYIFYEGVGGWKVPLNDQETMVDLALCLQLPLILVIGIRVGCINHALLTWEAIAKENLTVAGWIGNIIDPSTPVTQDHIATLAHWIDAPCLGTLPFNFSASHVLDIHKLIASASFHSSSLRTSLRSSSLRTK